MPFFQMDDFPALGMVLNKMDSVHSRDLILEMADKLGAMAEACITNVHLERANELR